MTTKLRPALALLALLAIAAVAVAKPDNPGKPDCSASFHDVEVAVAATCDCAAASNHGQFVRCAGRVVKDLATGGMLARTCKGPMVRVFAKSTCGKPDMVTCCVTGRPCRVKRTEVCDRFGG